MKYYRRAVSDTELLQASRCNVFEDRGFEGSRLDIWILIRQSPPSIYTGRKSARASGENGTLWDRKRHY